MIPVKDITAYKAFNAGGLALASLAVPIIARGAGPVEIQMRSSPRGEEVWFDPIGVRIEPGQTIRPFDYFVGRAATQAWIPVPEAARAAFPSVAVIVSNRAVRRR